MLQAFAQKAGLKLEFGALIASLASGKVDMIASDAYMEDKTAAIALKRNIAHLKNSDLTDAGNRSFWGGLTQSFYSNILQEHRYMLIIDGV